jgi:hypothetical protein
MDPRTGQPGRIAEPLDPISEIDPESELCKASLDPSPGPRSRIRSGKASMRRRGRWSRSSSVAAPIVRQQTKSGNEFEYSYDLLQLSTNDARQSYWRRQPRSGNDSAMDQLKRFI